MQNLRQGLTRATVAGQQRLFTRSAAARQEQASFADTGKSTMRKEDKSKAGLILAGVGVALIGALYYMRGRRTDDQGQQRRSSSDN